ncbi:hypothetical protein SDC9_169868 [bioreactor metagenome]|uniref:Uncharacterized protein n=1 Tax=bioreactor metagenome TaxID=1076179 RepID=A0A645G761_9ZZZZ
MRIAHHLESRDGLELRLAVVFVHRGTEGHAPAHRGVAHPGVACAVVDEHPFGCGRIGIGVGIGLLQHKAREVRHEGRHHRVDIHRLAQQG